jgi:hypothetical protein
MPERRTYRGMLFNVRAMLRPLWLSPPLQTVTSISITRGRHRRSDGEHADAVKGLAANSNVKGERLGAESLRLGVLVMGSPGGTARSRINSRLGNWIAFMLIYGASLGVTFTAS